MASGEYHVLPMGGPPNQRCRIIWRTDGSVKTPVDGFPYVPVPGEEPVPDDLPDLVPESEVEQDYMESERIHTGFFRKIPTFFRKTQDFSANSSKHSGKF